MRPHPFLFFAQNEVAQLFGGLMDVVVDDFVIVQLRLRQFPGRGLHAPMHFVFGERRAAFHARGEDFFFAAFGRAQEHQQAGGKQAAHFHGTLHVDYARDIFTAVDAFEDRPGRHAIAIAMYLGPFEQLIVLNQAVELVLRNEIIMHAVFFTRPLLACGAGDGFAEGWQHIGRGLPDGVFADTGWPRQHQQHAQRRVHLTGCTLCLLCGYAHLEKKVTLNRDTRLLFITYNEAMKPHKVLLLLLPALLFSLLFVVIRQQRSDAAYLLRQYTTQEAGLIGLLSLVKRWHLEDSSELTPGQKPLLRVSYFGYVTTNQKGVTKTSKLCLFNKSLSMSQRKKLPADFPHFPDSVQPLPPIENLMLVSYRQNGKWHTRLYDRKSPPAMMEEVEYLINPKHPKWKVRREQ